MSLMPEPHDPAVYLTPGGRDQVSDRVRRLEAETIPRLRERVEVEGDDALRAQLDAAISEAAELGRVLHRARSADQIPDDPGAVELGEAVTVRIDEGDPQRFVVVDPHEALLRDEHHISSESPLGRELLGRRIGDRFRVQAPGGAYECRIEGASR